MNFINITLNLNETDNTWIRLTHFWISILQISGDKRMNLYTTEIQAIDHTNGELLTWQGPNIEAESFEEAEQICLEKFGYLKVTGEFVQEIGWNAGFFATKIVNQNNN